MDIVVGPSESSWRDFVGNVSGSNIFQSPEMARVLGATKGFAPRTLAAESRGEIRALMLSNVISYRVAGLPLPAVRAVIVGGPLGDPDAFSVLLNAHDAALGRRVLQAQIRNLQAPTSLAPFVGAGFGWEDHLNFVLDLRKGEEGLLREMSKGRRKAIARAERSGLRVVDLCPSELEGAYRILKETYSRAGIPLADLSLFRAAMHHLQPRSMLWAVGAMENGQFEATRFVLRWGGALYDWYSGSTTRGRNLHADEFLVWEVLTRGVAQGCSAFDFCGAGRPGEDYGPGEFKRRFGGSLTNPGRLVKTYHRLAWTFGQASLYVWKRLSSPAFEQHTTDRNQEVPPWVHG